MRVHLYEGGLTPLVAHSGVGQAICHQRAMLAEAGVELTDGWKGRADAVHINTVLPDAPLAALRARLRGETVVWYLSLIHIWVLTLSGTVHTTCENGVYAVGSVDAGLIYPGARLRSFAVGQTVRRLVAWKPDVVHSQCEFSTFFLARHIARAVGAPLIHTYHTVYELSLIHI